MARRPRRRSVERNPFETQGIAEAAAHEFRSKEARRTSARLQESVAAEGLEAWLDELSG